MHYTEILAVVVSFNGFNKTSQTIRSLQGKVGYILIVDNASDPVSLGMLSEFESENNITLKRLNENKGVGHALNLGVGTAKELGYKWLLTMDQDSIIDPSMIDSFCMAVERNPDLVCLTPNIVINGRRMNEQNGVVNYAITSGNLVKRELFDVIGLYDESMFIDCIDFDFSLRVRTAGYEMYQLGDAWMQHELGDAEVAPQFFARFYTTHSPLRRYYMFRNHLYLMKKHATDYPFFLLKLTVAHLILLMLIPIFDRKPFVSLKYVCNGINDFFFNRSGAYLEHHK